MRTVNDDIREIIRTVEFLEKNNQRDTDFIEECIWLYHKDGEDKPEWIDKGISELERRTRLSGMILDALRKFTEEDDQRMNRSA